MGNTPGLWEFGILWDIWGILLDYLRNMCGLCVMEREGERVRNACGSTFGVRDYYVWVMWDSFPKACLSVEYFGITRRICEGYERFERMNPT